VQELLRNGQPIDDVPALAKQVSSSSSNIYVLINVCSKLINSINIFIMFVN